VLIDPETLVTLPSAEFRSGLAEVLKAAIIGDAALFEQIAGGGGGALAQVIADAARVKVRVVERDPLEQGDRAWLNLGHTFGHALEVISGYALRHGEAVALGTIAAAEMSASLGMCNRRPAGARPPHGGTARPAAAASVRSGGSAGGDGHGQETARPGAAFRRPGAHRAGDGDRGASEQAVLGALETIRGE